MWSNRNQLRSQSPHWALQIRWEVCYNLKLVLTSASLQIRKEEILSTLNTLSPDSSLTPEKWNMLRNKLNLVLIFAVSSPASPRCTKTQVSPHCSRCRTVPVHFLQRRARVQGGMKHAACSIGGKLESQPSVVFKSHHIKNLIGFDLELDNWTESAVYRDGTFKTP